MKIRALIAGFLLMSGAARAVELPVTNPPTSINNIWYWMADSYTPAGTAYFLVTEPSGDPANPLLRRLNQTAALAAVGGGITGPANSVLMSLGPGQSELFQPVALPNCPDMYGQFLYFFQNIGPVCVPGKSANAIGTGMGSAPGSVTTTSFKMLGLAGVQFFGLNVTPMVSGNVDLSLSGGTLNQTLTGAHVAIELVMGTGAPPAYGAAVPGGAIVASNVQTLTIDGGAGLRFTVNMIGWATGLTLGTPYWVDVAIAAPTGGTAQLFSLSLRAVEE